MNTTITTTTNGSLNPHTPTDHHRQGGTMMPTSTPDSNITRPSTKDIYNTLAPCFNNDQSDNHHQRSMSHPPPPPPYNSSSTTGNPAAVVPIRLPPLFENLSVEDQQSFDRICQDVLQGGGDPAAAGGAQSPEPSQNDLGGKLPDAEETQQTFIPVTDLQSEVPGAGRRDFAPTSSALTSNGGTASLTATTGNASSPVDLVVPAVRGRYQLRPAIPETLHFVAETMKSWLLSASHWLCRHIFVPYCAHLGLVEDCNTALKKCDVANAVAAEYIAEKGIELVVALSRWVFDSFFIRLTEIDSDTMEISKGKYAGLLHKEEELEAMRVRLLEVQKEHQVREARLLQEGEQKVQIITSELEAVARRQLDDALTTRASLEKTYRQEVEEGQKRLQEKEIEKVQLVAELKTEKKQTQDVQARQLQLRNQMMDLQQKLESTKQEMKLKAKAMALQAKKSELELLHVVASEFARGRGYDNCLENPIALTGPVGEQFLNAIKSFGYASVGELLQHKKHYVVGLHGTATTDAICGIFENNFDPGRRKVQYYGVGEYFDIADGGIADGFAKGTDSVVVALIVTRDVSGNKLEKEISFHDYHRSGKTIVVVANPREGSGAYTGQQGYKPFALNIPCVVASKGAAIKDEVEKNVRGRFSAEFKKMEKDRKNVTQL